MFLNVNRYKHNSSITDTNIAKIFLSKWSKFIAMDRRGFRIYRIKISVTKDAINLRFMFTPSKFPRKTIKRITENSVVREKAGDSP